MFRIKICGIRNPVEAVAAASADAIGLNFFPGSPRYVNLEMAKQIIQATNAKAVGVFVEASSEPIREIASQLNLAAVQTYREPQFDNDFAPTPHIPAFRIQYLEDLASIQAYILGQTTPPAAILVDSRSETAFGGTGVAAPWKLLAGFNPGVPLILAGGLTPENVAEAIRIVNPYGVDVASGVESAPGVKDRFKVEDFITAARAAFAAL